MLSEKTKFNFKIFSHYLVHYLKDSHISLKVKHFQVVFSQSENFKVTIMHHFLNDEEWHQKKSF